MTRLWVTLAAIVTFLMARTAVPAASQFRERPAPAAATAPTCNASQIDPRSYALTTRAQASIVTADRLDWLDGFDVGSAFEALHDLNALSTSAAERALEIDPNNRIKVNLHGAVGTVEVHASPAPREPAGVSVNTMGIGPLAYQVRVRQVIAAMVDPAGRIARPKASRSAGW